MDHSVLKNLIPAYCLGALDEDEKRQIEDHLKHGCAECQSALEEMRQVPDALPFAAPPQDPPPYLKDRIVAALEPEAQEPAADTGEGRPASVVIAAARSLRRWRFAAISFGLAAVILAITLARMSSIWQTERQELRSQATISNQLILELQTELGNKDRILRIIQSPQLKMADLKGLELSPNATAKVVWDPQAHQAVFYGSSLAAIPADKDYQLWMLRGNQPVSAAVFSPDARGTSVAEFQTIIDEENLSAFAITLEPKGGVAQPTGDMYLIGTL